MRKALGYWFGILVLLLSVGAVYFHTQVETIYGGDAGDLVSAIITAGIAHPPGYPLYTMLGIDLVQLIPLQTIAWRVAFLSSFSSLLSLVFLYDLLVSLSKKISIAILSCLVLAFLYPIWLYSIVVEVFALNNFFTIFLIWCLYYFHTKRNMKYLYVFTFTFGLALTHHHIILFLVPMLGYMLFLRKSLIVPSTLVKCVCLFLLGLIPYSYTLYAASFNPALNWQGQPTFIHFIELITRAGYGSFRAGSFIAHEPVLRLVNIWAFLDFVYKDFRIAGVFLICIGIVYLWIRNRFIAKALILGIISYLFFLFYASFPLVENFLVGTFERFIAPLYLLFLFPLCFGILATMHIFQTIISKVLKRKQPVNLVNNLLIIVFFLLPAGLFILNYPNMRILKKDFTAEYLGRDILNSVLPDSILLISTDTPLFNTQYVYYSEKKWPDVKLIHFTKLFTPYYNDQIQKWYPNVVKVRESSSSLEAFQTFLDDNYAKFPIYSKVSFATEKGIWIPYGLVFRYFDQKDIPTPVQIAAENGRLWASYQDPLSGSLSQFQHLMMSDILRVYSIASQEIGFYLARHGMTKGAEDHLIRSKKLFAKDVDSYKLLSQVYILEDRCDEAQEQIEVIPTIDPEDTGFFYLSALNYGVCYKDASKASYFQKLFEEKSRGKETPLQKL